MISTPFLPGALAMRLKTFLLGLAVSATTVGSICTISISQEEGRGGQPGGGRGGPPGGGSRGGPGGFTGRGGGGGISGLIRMEEVQKELKLEDEQKKELAAIVERMRESFGGAGGPGGAGGRPGGGQPGGGRPEGGRPEGGRPEGGRPEGGRPEGGRPGAGGGQPGGGMTADRLKEIQAMTARLAEAREKVDGEIMGILDPDQADRILGLLIQSEDGKSLNTSALTDALGLAPDQKSKVKSVTEAYNSERMTMMQKAFEGGSRGPDSGMAEQFEAASKKNNNDLLAVLTSEQKAKFESMKGEKFTFPESRGFGGAGGPGGGTRGTGGQPREGGTGGGRPGRPTTPGT